MAGLSAPGVNSLESEDNILQSYAAQLARLNSAWDNREDTAARLRERAEALRTHQHLLTGQIGDILSPDTFQADPSTQLVQPVPLVQPALAILVAALQQVASASQQLPSNSSEALSTTTASWNTSLFVVKTVQSVLTSCFKATSDSEGDAHSSENSWQSSIARHAIEALQASLSSWNQTTVLPSLIAQLQQSASNLVSAEQKQQLEAPNGMDPDSLQDLSALELEPSVSNVSGRGGFALQGKDSPSAADLVPFSDFDTALAGADQTLESALEDSSQELATETSLDLEVHAQSDSSPKTTKADVADVSLVPFSDFDEALGGADESLESVDDDDNGALEAEITSGTQGSQESASSSSEVQRLSVAMTQYVLSAGAVAAAEQQLAVAATARSEAEARLESGSSKRQLVALEWEHEELLQETLQPQGSLGQPIVIMPKVFLGCLQVLNGIKDLVAPVLDCTGTCCKHVEQCTDDFLCKHLLLRPDVEVQSTYVLLLVSQLHRLS